MTARLDRSLRLGPIGRRQGGIRSGTTKSWPERHTPQTIASAFFMQRPRAFISDLPLGAFVLVVVTEHRVVGSADERQAIERGRQVSVPGLGHVPARLGIRAL